MKETFEYSINLTYICFIGAYIYLFLCFALSYWLAKSICCNLTKEQIEKSKIMLFGSAVILTPISILFHFLLFKVNKIFNFYVKYIFSMPSLLLCLVFWVIFSAFLIFWINIMFYYVWGFLIIFDYMLLPEFIMKIINSLMYNREFIIF